MSFFLTDFYIVQKEMTTHIIRVYTVFSLETNPMV